MKAPKSETWRLRYLRILTGPASDATKDSQDDLQALEDLVEERLIRGVVRHDQEGIVRAAAILRGDDGLIVPTLKGQLFIEEQKAILKSKTFLGRLKANWPLFSGLVGIVIGWSLGLSTPFVQQRFFPPTQPQTTAPTSNAGQQQPAAQTKLPLPAVAPATPAKP